MKGHKEHHHRSHRATGGVNTPAEDLKRKNMRYTYESNVDKEAEERNARQERKRKKLAAMDVEAIEGEIEVDGIKHKLRLFKPESLKNMDNALDEDDGEPVFAPLPIEREHAFCPTCKPKLPETDSP